MEFGSETVDVRGNGSDKNAINDISYNAKDQRTEIYYANGSKTKYEYDPETFRVQRILTTRNNGADILQDLNYTYDAAGNITEMKDDAQQTIYFANQVVPPLCKYTYDSLYRLKKATGRENSNLDQPSHEDIPIRTPIPDGSSDACRNYTLNYSYDELGNILQIQHTAQNGNWTRDYYYPSDSNKVIGHEDGQTDYTYDAAGNMLSMPHLSNMVWDENNMLIEADLGGGGTAYYRYDTQGQRVRKVIVNGNVKKERLYIGDFELWQQNTNGTVENERETLNISDPSTSSGQVKSFLRLETLTVDNGNSVSDPGTNWRYQYDNHLGSACLELDDSADVISYEEYFPFGATSYRSGKNQSEVKLKRYRYCGKERDEETGLYYYGARYYAAWIGRFVSVDPMAEETPSWSPYVYTHNNPLRFTDPTGMSADDVIIKGEQAQQAFEQLQASTDLKLKLVDGKVGIIGGKATSKSDLKLKEAIESKKTTVNINTTDGFLAEDGVDFIGGAFRGSTVNDDETVDADQLVNPEVLGIMDDYYERGHGTGIKHEVLEGFIGGEESGGSDPATTQSGHANYLNAHGKAKNLDLRYKNNTGKAGHTDNIISRRGMSGYWRERTYHLSKKGKAPKVLGKAILKY